MSNWVFLNDRFVPEKEAVLSYRDLSFQRGYGIFDFFRLKGDTPLFLEDHLNRFYFSAENAHLSSPLEREALKAAIFELLKKNSQPNTGVRLSLTGGYSEDGFNIGQPALLLSQHPFSAPTEQHVQQGIKLLSYSFQRPLPQIKSIDYLMAVWLQPKRLENGADDLLYMRNGYIGECPRSNFFLVTEDNRIVTPAENVLLGITRKKVLEIAKQHFVTEERPVAYDEIFTAKESFITSTTKQILPVAKIDGHSFLQHRISHQILQLFQTSLMNAPV